MEARIAHGSALAAMLLLTAADVVNAQGRPLPIQPGHRVRYYEVSGDSLESLQRSLEENAPTGPTGLKAFGLTEWQVGWYYFPWKRQRDCKLIYVSTSLGTIITLPRWVDAADAPPSVARWWDAFIEALEGHENGHLENARAAEKAVGDALSKIEPAETCGVAAREADRTALEILWSHQSLDRQYDRDTRYGRDQVEAALSRE